MSTLDDIRAAIVAEISAVAAIGIVHNYERYAQREGDFRARYLYDLGAGDKQIRGWYVRRLTTRQNHEVMGSYDDHHDWLIRGFMAIDDAAASELVFDGLIEAVRERFRLNASLSGLISSVYSPEGKGPELVESQPVMFGGVLCHSARLHLSTWHLF